MRIERRILLFCLSICLTVFSFAKPELDSVKIVHDLDKSDFELKNFDANKHSAEKSVIYFETENGDDARCGVEYAILKPTLLFAPSVARIQLKISQPRYIGVTIVVLRLSRKKTRPIKEYALFVQGKPSIWQKIFALYFLRNAYCWKSF